jgi:hypothetical protein
MMPLMIEMMIDVEIEMKVGSRLMMTSVTS